MHRRDTYLYIVTYVRSCCRINTFIHYLLSIYRERSWVCCQYCHSCLRHSWQYWQQSRDLSLYEYCTSLQLPHFPSPLAAFLWSAVTNSLCIFSVCSAVRPLVSAAYQSWSATATATENRWTNTNELQLPIWLLYRIRWNFRELVDIRENISATGLRMSHTNYVFAKII